MITKLTINNFKRLTRAELELGNSVVFIGPNNSGKTSALQAIALWDVGWRRWAEKRDESAASERKGVAINRRDLYAIPVPSSRLLWKDLHLMDTAKAEGKKKTEKVYITVRAEGVFQDQPWSCELEFYYVNEESLMCRLRDVPDGKVPDGVRAHSVVFLPPMSGLAEREHRKEAGEVSVLIGEGRTAEVLRNLCWQLFSKSDKRPWNRLIGLIDSLFHVELQDPIYIKERSELALSYRERSSGVEFDLSSSGRGCQQVLLLLAYLLANPGAVLLLDEPDAHLEILRQRDVYNLITDLATESGSQVIAASHSEVVLQEAAQKDVVIAFLGKPHRIDSRSKGQVAKSLEKIRMADYYLAEQKGWMLYLEGSTDLAILSRLAGRLDHLAKSVLHDSVPVYYLGNNRPQEARDHFQGLREAKPDLAGFALFDRLGKPLHEESALIEKMWSRREIENYLVTPASLRAFVLQDVPDGLLFEESERERRLVALESSLAELVNALKVTGKPDPWGSEIKVTDEFLDPLFKLFYEKLGIPQQTFKRDYHALADAIPLEELSSEITDMLNALLAVAQKATPAT